MNDQQMAAGVTHTVMDRTDNNITKAAKLLGLTFRTLQYRLEKFGYKKDGEGTDEDKEA